MSITSPPTACPSCGSARAGAYCTRCGERFLEPEDFEFRHFLRRHLFHEIFELDGRLMRSLRVLFVEPGRLAADYVAGRRRPFVSPLRLYLVVFIVHAFIVASSAGQAISLPQRAKLIDPTGLLTRLIAARPTIDWSNPNLEERLTERERWFGEFGTLLIFFGVALVQKLVFYRQKRRYLEHATLALTVSAFFLTLIAAAELVARVFGPTGFGTLANESQEWLALTALPLYWVLAVRRFYGLRLTPSILGGFLVTASNWMVATILNAIVLGVLIAGA